MGVKLGLSFSKRMIESTSEQRDEGNNWTENKK